MQECVRLAGPEAEVRITRGPDGVPVIGAGGERDLAFAQGWLHARDRQIQMMFTRAVGQGRLAECFAATEAAVRSDVFMRRLGLAYHLEGEVGQLEEETRGWLQDYADGVNRYLGDAWRRLEFRLVGFEPEPWQPADSLLTLKVASYLGLAQSQQDIEKLLVQWIQDGADVDFLRRLFHPYLRELDQSTLDLLRRVRIEEPYLTRELPPSELIPSFQASNNWVLAPHRSATGSALLATDPHLEVNRLPPVWYESVAQLPGDYHMGVNMPGLPGMAMGRTQALAFGFTYGCMDQVDYFLEDCREGSFRRDDSWEPFRQRTEIVWRKGREPLLVEVFENDLGVLEGDPRVEGIYLLRAWSGLREGAAETFRAFRSFLRKTRVSQAQPLLAQVLTSCNWLLADRHGSIGYQQSGILPRRQGDGLLPRPAWIAANHWQGRVDPEELLRVTDPPEGYLASTNDRHQNPTGPLTMNLSSGEYRRQRIHSLLQERERFDLEDLKRFQLDLFSPQAERYLEFFRPLLPDTPAARDLSDWDCCYRLQAPEAVWFEAIYQRLMGECFGHFFGPGAWDKMLREAGLLNDFHVLLDDLFLDPTEALPGLPDRHELARGILAEELAAPPRVTWGEVNQVVMRHLLLGDRLPRLLGFDLGPVPLAGGRATLCQGRIYDSHGRRTTFVPSWRFVTDLGEDRCQTALPGGVSDSRFSRWYTEGFARWLGGEYKDLTASPLPVANPDGRPDPRAEEG